MTEQQLATTYKPRAIGNPIAKNGDKNSIPDTSDDTGVVNIDKGFPSKYSTPRAEGGKSVSRKDMNGMFNLLSQQEYFQQYMGRTLWDSGVASTGYPKGAKVWFYDASGNSAEYVSKVDNNKGTPGVSTDWVKTGNADGNVVDASSISAAIDPKLANYVSLSGTQTVTGAKTFSGAVSFNASPTVPTVEASSLSETGTRAVNEATLLSAIGSYSTGGMFIDPSSTPTLIYNLGTDNPTAVTGPSVIYINSFTPPYAQSSSITGGDLLYSSTGAKEYGSWKVLSTITCDAMEPYHSTVGAFGPFYIKSGYVCCSNRYLEAFLYALI